MSRTPSVRPKNWWVCVPDCMCLFVCLSLRCTSWCLLSFFQRPAGETGCSYPGCPAARRSWPSTSYCERFLCSDPGTFTGPWGPYRTSRRKRTYNCYCFRKPHLCRGRHTHPPYIIFQSCERKRVYEMSRFLKAKMLQIHDILFFYDRIVNVLYVKILDKWDSPPQSS